MMMDEILGLSDFTVEASNSASQSGLQYLPQRFPLFQTAAMILALAVVYGDAVCLLSLRGVSLYWTESVVLRLGIGLGVLATVTLCCGLAGQLNKVAICLPAILCLGVVTVLRWRRRNEIWLQTISPAVPKHMSKTVVSVVLLIISPFIIYVLLGSVSPPTDFDVR